MDRGKRKKRGRPPLAPDEGKRETIGLRVTAAVRQQLETAAARSGRSMSQEAELRLERALAVTKEEEAALDMAYGRRLAGLLMLVGRVMGRTGTVRRLLSTDHKDRSPRTTWLSDRWAFDEAVAAANAIFAAYRPAGEPTPVQQGWRSAASAEMALHSLRKDGGTSAELEHVYERIGPPLNAAEGGQ